jgi:hypothetical protein
MHSVVDQVSGGIVHQGIQTIGLVVDKHTNKASRKSGGAGSCKTIEVQFFTPVL